MSKNVIVVPTYNEMGNIEITLKKIENLKYNFDVVVVDDRADLASRQYLPDSHQVIVGDIATELGRYPIDELTYVVIVTRGHNHDEEALHAVVNSNARYIGLIGSRRKIKLIFDDLVELLFFFAGDHPLVCVVDYDDDPFGLEALFDLVNLLLGYRCTRVILVRLLHIVCYLV